MIGLSISFCISEMVSGVVNPSTVEKIIGGTAAAPEHIDELVAEYRRSYWSWNGNPDEAERLFRELLAAGRIEQPRLVDGRFPMIYNGHWVESEDQIEWGGR